MYLRSILLSTVFSVASPFFLSETANAVPPNQSDEVPVLSRVAPVPSGRRDNAMNDAAVLLASMGSSNDRSEASSQDKESLQESRPVPVLAQPLLTKKKPEINVANHAAVIKENTQLLEQKSSNGDFLQTGKVRSDLLNKRARAYLEGRKYVLAIQDLDEALGMMDAEGQSVLTGDDRARALARQGGCHAFMGHYPQALHDLDEVLGMMDAEGQSVLTGADRAKLLIYRANISKIGTTGQPHRGQQPQKQIASRDSAVRGASASASSSAPAPEGSGDSQQQLLRSQQIFIQNQPLQPRVRTVLHGRPLRGQQPQRQTTSWPGASASASSSAPASEGSGDSQQQLIRSQQTFIQSQQRIIDQQLSEIKSLRKRLAESESETQRPEKRSRND